VRLEFCGAYVEPDNTTAQPDANVVSSVSTGRQIAFIVVLPVFFICYGGSCVIYCVHKIYIHCRRSDDEKKWKTLDAIQPSTPARPRIPYPQRLQADKFSKKTMPPPNYPFVYISGSMFKTPPTYEQKKVEYLFFRRIMSRS
jgi:hypothetical protein